MKQKKVNQKPVFLTQNDVMIDLVKKVKQVAQRGCTELLVTGENGTGKEVIAQLYHYFSSRQDKPMVAVNCGAIPEDLVESELFGHEKGAFTGAHEQKKGCFELADGGTLFLDEIGEMPQPMQVKLLRVVELGSFRRVGGTEEIQVDISLVSATNKVLIDQVKSGSFREDLFYRINVIELFIPPLRHRKEDIPLLVNYYKECYKELYSLHEMEFSEECMETFMGHDWPGNVRELKNVVERCMVLCEGGKIELEQLPPRIRNENEILPVNGNHYSNEVIQIPIGTSLEKIEQHVIGRTLNSVDNNKTEAAKILGFTRKTLHNKLDKYKDMSSNEA
ncbi:DNA-binding response regulator [Aliifodinibius salipaludis]|uniref:DNA-binding response regulator n=1 Tax=Fodinibius salipaludis TaxID=2032627 RepID=A0A2A2GDD8_9BACT|nr:sigma-54 dependent transcriptional regulator [Aliifodinibius salipaludis]PAU94792.1 DNA-binding response regulator [Aliifodinibius salipaludis]